MISTLVIMSINATVNYYRSSVTKYAFFTIYLTIRSSEDGRRMIIQSIIEFFVYSSEVFLLWFTTDNIDYKEYLYYLMIGINKPEMISRVSLFLVYVYIYGERL